MSAPPQGIEIFAVTFQEEVEIEITDDWNVEILERQGQRRIENRIFIPKAKSPKSQHVKRHTAFPHPVVIDRKSAPLTEGVMRLDRDAAKIEHRLVMRAQSRRRPGRK